jgi:hypothetical protein
MSRSLQVELPFARGTRGGWRRGAGRKTGSNPRIRHLSRPNFPSHLPCHVTLKVLPGLPSLRDGRIVRAVVEAFRCGAERGSFRILEFSIQSDHLHAIVEADGPAALVGRHRKLTP